MNELLSVKSLNSLNENLDDISCGDEEEDADWAESIDEMFCEDDKEAVKDSDTVLGVENVGVHAVINSRRVIRIVNG